MAIDLSNVKGISIPQGNIKGISVNGVDLWSKSGGGGDEPAVLLSWEHVLWSIANNRYTTDYSVGDLFPLDLGTEGNINMQIAAFDHDDLADGTGKAHISFISKELCSNTSKMNSTSTNAGGWKDSLMRNTTMPVIREKLPTILQESIVEVVKKSSAGRGSATIVSTNDKLWIPSLYEIDSSQSSSPYPDEGTTYPIFTDVSSRIKTRNGSSNDWWSRSPRKANNYRFMSMLSHGSASNNAADDSLGVCLGFCL